MSEKQTFESWLEAVNEVVRVKRRSARRVRDCDARRLRTAWEQGLSAEAFADREWGAVPIGLADIPVLGED